MTIHDLIERLKAGDEEALEAIFNRYSAKLYNVAQRILGEVTTRRVAFRCFLDGFSQGQKFWQCSNFDVAVPASINAALGKNRRSKKNKEIKLKLPTQVSESGHHSVRPVIDWSDTLDEKYATGIAAVNGQLH